MASRLPFSPSSLWRPHYQRTPSPYGFLRAVGLHSLYRWLPFWGLKPDLCNSYWVLGSYQAGLRGPDKVRYHVSVYMGGSLSFPPRTGLYPSVAGSVLISSLRLRWSHAILTFTMTLWSRQDDIQEQEKIKDWRGQVNCLVWGLGLSLELDHFPICTAQGLSQAITNTSKKTIKTQMQKAV